MRLGRKHKVVVAVLLAVYSAILVWNCARVGITTDEPGRLLGGHLYWMNLPDHDPMDQPPLLSILTGWAPRFLGIPLMRDHPIWKSAWKEHVYSYILDSLPGPAIGRLFFLARLGVICFPILTGLLIWHWAKKLVSGTAALVTLLVFLLLPVARGHGPLITSDLAATFTYMLAGYCAWRYWREPSPGWAVLLACAAGGAMLAKLSLLIVPPLAAAVVLLRSTRPPRRLRTAFFALGVMVVIPWLITVAAYKFDTRRMTPGELSDMVKRGEFSPGLVAAARVLEYIPTPREMQRGVRSMGEYYRDGTSTYFLGRINQYGHRAYYPVCLALKMPITFLVLVLVGFVVLIAGMAGRRIPADRLFLLVSALIYLGFAMHSSIQIGVRLILPAIGFLVLVAAFGIDYLLAVRGGRTLLGALLAFLVVSTGRVFPHDIAYFNELAGGPENGWRYLSDSNIDWGQSYPELAAYVKKHGIKSFKLFPYGFDKVHRYFPNGEAEVQFSPWTPDRIQSRVLEPAPGIYAVPVALLSGQYYEPQYREYLRFFRDRAPDGRAGFGIYIYRVAGDPSASQSPSGGPM